MQQYIFFREIEGKPMFYPVEYATDSNAISGAIYNTGTTKVEKPSGEVIFPVVKH